MSNGTNKKNEARLMAYLARQQMAIHVSEIKKASKTARSRGSKQDLITQDKVTKIELHKNN